MKIYLAIKFHSDNQNQQLIEDISSHLRMSGHEVICAVRDFESWGSRIFDPQEILMKAFATIDSNDIVLVEASEKGMGVGIEAGYAFARKIPVITIAQKGSDLSVNLRSLSKSTQIYDRVSEITM